MRFPIVKHFKYFMGLTLLVLFIGVISIFTRGFNMGIDFTGGSIVDLTFENEVTVSQVRDVLSQAMCLASMAWATALSSLKTAPTTKNPKACLSVPAL